MRNLILLSLSFILGLIACQKEVDGVLINPPSDSLYITSFTPDSARIGDEIIIRGKGFDTALIAPSVYINNIPVALVSHTDTLMVIKILPGATTGKISVVVLNDTATSIRNFVILPDSLQIKSFTPDSGAVGTQVTIKGKGFSSTVGNNVVTINNTNSEIISSNDSVLVIKVLPGTTTGKITIKANGQTATTTTNFSVIVPPSNPWVQKADCPAVWPNTYGGFVNAFAIGDKGYYTKYGKLWQYSPATNTWTQKADIPGMTNVYTFCFTINGKAYVGLGGTGPGISIVNQKQVWQYDPATDTWTRKNDFPGPPRVAPFSFELNGMGYVGAGDTANSNFAHFNDFWQYNPQTDQWTKKANYPTANGYATGATGFSIGNKGYVLEAGFNNPPSALRAQTAVPFWQYDDVTNQWTQKASLSVPGQKIISAACFTINGKGYAALGADGFTARNDFWEYDPALNQWIQKPDAGSNYRIFGSAFAINGKGYVGLGNGSTITEVKKDFWEYTPQ